MGDRRCFFTMTTLWLIVGVSQSSSSIYIYEETAEGKQKRAGFVLGSEIAKKLQERMKELNNSYPMTVQEDGATYHLEFEKKNDGTTSQKGLYADSPSPWIRRAEEVHPREPDLPPVLKPNLHAPLPQGFSPEVYLLFNKAVSQQYYVAAVAEDYPDKWAIAALIAMYGRPMKIERLFPRILMRIFILS